MDPRERFAQAEEAIRLAIRADRVNLWTALPGIIESYDSIKQTVVVQPSLQGVIQGTDGNYTAVNLPLLPDVPVIFPGGGGCTLTFPIKKGDECLVVFSSRCIDWWWDKGGIQLPGEPRLHSLSDGFAIVGPRSQPRKLSNVSTSKVQLRSDDGVAHIDLDPTSHEVDVITAGNVNLSGSQVTSTASKGNSVLGPYVMLGQGSAGNLNSLPAPAETLYSNYMASGASAVLSNPVAPSLTTLSTSLTSPTINNGLSDLVTAGKITSTDQTNIMNALTGPGGLQAATTSLTAHTNLLSGVTAPANGTVPHLDGVIGLSGALDNVTGGALGNTSTLIGSVTTGLGSAASVTAANTYINGIVAALNAGTTTPTAVITNISSYTNTLNGYVTNDTSNYSTIKGQVAKASGFLGAASYAKNPSTTVQSVLGQVMSPSTISALQQVGG